MRNYRRLSGDGSVKVVLSGDSNSPPKTTPRREPPSYNSSPAQEVCPSYPAVATDVRRLISPANRSLHPRLAARAGQADPCLAKSSGVQSKVNNFAPAQSHSDSQKVDSSPNAGGALVKSFKGGQRSLRRSFHPCYAAISRISSPNKKIRLPLKYRLRH